MPRRQLSVTDKKGHLKPQLLSILFVSSEQIILESCIIQIRGVGGW